MATNTRPSGAKRTTVGLPSPLQTVVSVKPGGNCVAACADGTQTATSKTATSKALRTKRTLGSAS